MEFAIVALVCTFLGFVLATATNSQQANLREKDLQVRVEECAEKLAEQKLRQSGATLKGQIGERFAPFIPGFGYEAAGARFLGSPIDYVVFDGI
jgi:predicted Holliday junction resolvase-like endonuclease